MDGQGRRERVAACRALAMPIADRRDPAHPSSPRPRRRGDLRWGRGAPVVRNRVGELEGVEAVVDKDSATGLLAEALDADMLLVLTDVASVETDYGTPAARPIHRAAPADLRALGFPAGSMGPQGRSRLPVRRAHRRQRRHWFAARCRCHPGRPGRAPSSHPPVPTSGRDHRPVAVRVLPPGQRRYRAGLRAEEPGAQAAEGAGAEPGDVHLGDAQPLADLRLGQPVSRSP